MKLILYIVIGSILFSCTTSLKNVKNKINSPERKRYEKNMTVVNQKALDDKVILYYGSAYGMTPTQAYNKAQESALIEMASSLATFVVSNSSQEIYEKSGTAYVINKLRDRIYTMNIIVDYQVVKYNEIEELGAYRCKVFISYSSEAARIIASERSNDILQSILNDTSDENKKSKSESISVQPADNKIDLIDFDETGFSDKEITNLIFARYIERLVPDYEI
ncbi:MAG: hypothetical protein KKD38_04400, partial [Candidatus Delongbacteria bacterium]|nr:hypothetical protein [Candidatus Delongbacteria bacterium]